MTPAPQYMGDKLNRIGKVSRRPATLVGAKPRITMERRIRWVLAITFGATAAYAGVKEHYWCIPLALVALMPISQRSVLSQIGRVITAIATMKK